MQKLHRHFETLGSTNETARAWAGDASTPAPHGASVSADEQTGGKGRRGRDWVSPKGRGVYL
jgi:BirA family biotin operon repressor/biotin-[acetyl-CoA-carboxylase] ligase